MRKENLTKILVIGNHGYLGKNIQDFFQKKTEYLVKGLDQESSLNYIDFLKDSEIVIFANGLSDHILGQENPYLDYQKNVQD